MGKFVTHLKAAVGATFTGYKGGNYTMSLETPVWVSHPGRSSSVGVIGFRETDWCVVIETKWINI